VVSTSTLEALSVTTAKIADSAITSAKINNGAVGADQLSTSITNVLPTDGQKSALAGTSGTPGVSNQYVTNSDGRIPTSDEKAALAGSSGSPSSTNKFLTAADPRVVPTVSATVPSSPVDGQLWLYRHASGATWMFRYNADGGTYKWEFVGGAPAIDHTATNQTVNIGTSFTALSSPASASLPFAGDYECGIAISFRIATSNRIVVFAPAIVSSGGTATVSANNGTANSTSSSAHWANGSRFDQLTNSAAGASLRIYGYADAAVNVEIIRHTVKATPIRVG
jgi:hypothetical protein